MTASPRSSFRRKSLLSIGLLLLLFVLVNALAYRMQSGLDLTPNHRFSVSQDMISLFDDFKTPIHIEYFVSKERPSKYAELERDVVRRLDALASASSNVHFDHAASLHHLEHDAPTYKKMRQLEIPPIVLSSGAQALSFYSALRISHQAVAQPILLPRVLSASSMQYDLVSKALRLQKLRPRPQESDASFRALTKGMRFIYVHGSPNGGPIPRPRTDLPEQVWSELERIQQLNPAHISISQEEAGKSNYTQYLQRIEDVVPPAKRLFYFSSIVVRDQFGEERFIDQINTTHKLADLLADYAWAAESKAEKVGIFIPDERPELQRSEIRVLYNTGLGGGTPETRVSSILNQLDYQTTSFGINQNTTIPHGLGALVLVRPNALNERQVFEIQAYLARGGKVLLVHGEWHAALIDNALRVNENSSSIADLWAANAQGASFGITPSRIEDSAHKLLSDYGINSSTGILFSESQHVPYRVYVPGQARPEQLYPQPLKRNGTLEIVPYATPGDHLLASDVQKLPLRASSVLDLNQQLLKDLGLKTSVLLNSPQDSVELAPTQEEALQTFHINYTSSISEPLASLFLNSDQTQGMTRRHVGARPVALLVEGQFPFDPSQQAPEFPDGSNPYTPGLGNAFIAKPGQLVVVSSPDLFEHVDLRGWRPGEAPLVGGSDQYEESSRRRFLANVIDSFVFGENLVRIRSSLTPRPHRLDEWSTTEMRNWSLLVVGLAPLLVLGLGAFVLVLRRKRRYHLQAISRTASSSAGKG